MKKNENYNIVEFLNNNCDKKILISYIIELLEVTHDAGIKTYSEAEIYSNYLHEKYEPESEDDIEEIFNEEFGFYNEFFEDPIDIELRNLIKNKGVKK